MTALVLHYLTRSSYHQKNKKFLFCKKLNFYPSTLILTLLLPWIITSCASQPYNPSHSGAVSIMSYNVENLFDTLPDPDREDYTFLPKSLKQTAEHKIHCAQLSTRQSECLERDWNPTFLDRKLDRLSQVILSTNKGHGPDLLILEEVENLRVLHQLNDNYLQKAGYKSVILIEGPDLRGIDVGMLSRFPLVGEAQLHLIPFQPRTDEDKKWMNRSRGVLEATFQLPSGELLTAFGVHLPSQANPSYWREQALDFINTLKGKMPSDRLLIVGGDFNVSAQEEAHHQFFQKKLGPQWLVSHLVGCKSCQGTHHYRGQWSFLDALLFSPSLGPEGKSKWKLDVNSIQVAIVSRYQTTPSLTPASFQEKRPVGVSDHYPIFAQIIPR